MSRCYDITGALDTNAVVVDRVTLDIARGCRDADRFLVHHAGAAHLLTPSATEALVSDWIEQPDRERSTDVVACALGTIVDGWLLNELDEIVLAAPTRQLDHLRWWRLLDSSFPTRTAAVFHGAEDDPGAAGNIQPVVGVGTYQNLLATMRRVLCVGDQARRRLTTLSGRPDEDFGVVVLPAEPAHGDEHSDLGIVAAVEALFAPAVPHEAVVP